MFYPISNNQPINIIVSSLIINNALEPSGDSFSHKLSKQKHTFTKLSKWCQVVPLAIL